MASCLGRGSTCSGCPTLSDHTQVCTQTYTISGVSWLQLAWPDHGLMSDNPLGPPLLTSLFLRTRQLINPQSSASRAFLTLPAATQRASEYQIRLHPESPSAHQFWGNILQCKPDLPPSQPPPQLFPPSNWPQEDLWHDPEVSLIFRRMSTSGALDQWECQFLTFSVLE